MVGDYRCPSMYFRYMCSIQYPRTLGHHHASVSKSAARVWLAPSLTLTHTRIVDCITTHSHQGGVLHAVMIRIRMVKTSVLSVSDQSSLTANTYQKDRFDSRITIWCISWRCSSLSSRNPSYIDRKCPQHPSLSKTKRSQREVNDSDPRHIWKRRPCPWDSQPHLRQG